MTNNKPKQLLVLVKGNLQGMTKNPKKLNASNFSTKLSICKKSFLNSFMCLYSANGEKSQKLSYKEAKNISNSYSDAKIQFYAQYSDWIRADQDKLYNFD